MATPKQALGVAAVVVGGAVGVSGAALGGCLATPPASIATDCSTDVGTQLSSEVNGLPPNSTVTLKSGACYLVNSTVLIQNTSGLTVNGNGATLKRTSLMPAGQKDPILDLRQNTNLTLNNVKVVGAYNGTNGGASEEGNYGISMQSNHGVTVSGMNMANVQGDFVFLSPPNDTGGTELNHNVAITGSTFIGAGYHGLTVESVNGLNVSSDIFANMGVDAIDFEVDVANTTFDAQGNAQAYAEDNVTIANNTWSDFQDDWFASLQGQSPGVQSQNVSLTGNTVNAMSPLVEVTGTNPYLTPKRYWNTGLTISGNHGLQPAISTHGGGAPGTEATMQIQAVVGLTITGNTFPLDQPHAPYLSVLQAFENQQMTITGNTFTGAYSVLQPGSAANTGSPCNNHFGPNASQYDGACPTS